MKKSGKPNECFCEAFLTLNSNWEKKLCFLPTFQERIVLQIEKDMFSMLMPMLMMSNGGLNSESSSSLLPFLLLSLGEILNPLAWELRVPGRVRMISFFQEIKIIQNHEKFTSSKSKSIFWFPYIYLGNKNHYLFFKF